MSKLCESISRILIFSSLSLCFSFSFSPAQPHGSNETRRKWEVKMNFLIRPATDTGVLFALVNSEATVPLSVALIDYHSTKKLKQQVYIKGFLVTYLVLCGEMVERP